MHTGEIDHHKESANVWIAFTNEKQETYKKEEAQKDMKSKEI